MIIKKKNFAVRDWRNSQIFVLNSCIKIYLIGRKKCRFSKIAKNAKSLHPTLHQTLGRRYNADTATHRQHRRQSRHFSLSSGVVVEADCPPPGGCPHQKGGHGLQPRTPELRLCIPEDIQEPRKDIKTILLFERAVNSIADPDPYSK